MFLLTSGAASAQPAQTPGEPPADGPRGETPQPPPAPTDDPWRSFRFGATFEGFYQYNWNEPFDRVNLPRAYDTRANVFGIQQATVLVENAPEVEAGRRFGSG
jgi:hypothetical protein